MHKKYIYSSSIYNILNKSYQYRCWENDKKSSVDFTLHVLKFIGFTNLIINSMNHLKCSIYPPCCWGNSKEGVECLVTLALFDLSSERMTVLITTAMPLSPN